MDIRKLPVSKICAELRSKPGFVNMDFLITNGIYLSKDVLMEDHRIGQGPYFVTIGAKAYYPRKALAEFIKNRFEESGVHPIAQESPPEKFTFEDKSMEEIYHYFGRTKNLTDEEVFALLGEVVKNKEDLFSPIVRSFAYGVRKVVKP